MRFVLCALCLAVGFPDEPALDIHHDFRTKGLDKLLFRLWGPDAAQWVTFAGEGMRVTFPENQKTSSPVGVVTQFTLKGNFELTISYEILKGDRPATGSGAGIEVYLMTDTPTQEAIGFYRVARPKEGDVYGCHRMTTKDGKRQNLGRRFATAAKSGKLRLTRTGPEVIFWAAEGADADFRELHRAQLGDEDVKGIYLRGYRNEAQTALDVLFKDFRVRAVELPRAPGEVAKPSTPEAAPRGRALWILSALVGGGLILGGAWAWLRKSHRRDDEIPRKKD